MDEKDILKNDDQVNGLVQEQSEGSLNASSPKKSNKTVISIIVGSLAFLCIAGVVIAKAVIPVAAPKLFVADALKTTQKTLLQEKKVIEDIKGTTLALQILESEAMQTDFDLYFKELTGEGVQSVNSMIGGMGISGQVKTDQSGQKLLMNLAVNQNTLRLAGAEFYKSNSEVGISIPELFDKQIAVNLDTFVEDYKQSALFDLIGEPIDEKAYNELRDYYENYATQNTDDEFNKRIVKKIDKLSEELYKQADVKHIGKTDSIMGTGNSDYNTYEVVLKESDIKKYIKDILNIVMEDQAMIDYIEYTDNMQKATNGQSMSKAIEESKIQINTAIDNVTFDDLKITLRIDSKKHIVESSYETIFKMNGESVEVKVDSGLIGKKFISDAMEFIVSIKYEEQEGKAVIKSTSNYGDKTNQLVHNITLVVEENKKMLSDISVGMSYDTKLKENNLALNAKVKTEDREVFSFTLDGTMNNDRSNKKIEYDMSNITFKIYDGYMDYGVAFSGKYSLSAIKNSDIKFKEDNIQYLFKMTKEELTAFEETVSEKLEQLGSMLF